MTETRRRAEVWRIDAAAALQKRLDVVYAERDRLREALEEIARADELVDANADAFSVHAFRRCQEVARQALAPGAESA